MTDPENRTEIHKARTKAFALRVIVMVRALPTTEEAKIIGRQVLRSGTAVGANYRAVCRARSDAEFAAKLGVVVEEIDETAFWLELLIEAKIVPAEKMAGLLKESGELLAIFAAGHRTVKQRLKAKSKSKAIP